MKSNNLKAAGATRSEGKRPRWNVEAHARWQKKISGGKISRSDAALTKSRADRILTRKHK